MTKKLFYTLIIFNLIFSWTLLVKPAWAVNTYSTDLEFDDADSFSHADNALFTLDNTFTIEFWRNKEEEHPYSVFVEKGGNTGSNYGYKLYYRPWETSPEELWTLQTSADGSNTQTNHSGTYTFATSTWTHFAVSVNCTANEVVFYKNAAVHATSTTACSCCKDNDQPFQIGQQVGVSRPTDNKLDEFRLWDDVRTGDEITANYQSELTSTSTLTQLVAYYQFENNPNDGGYNNSLDLTEVNSPAYDTDVPFGAAPPPAEEEAKQEFWVE